MHEGTQDLPSEASQNSKDGELTFKDSVNITSYAVVLVVVSWFMGFYWAKEHPDKFTLISLQRWLKGAPQKSHSQASTTADAPSMQMEFHEVTTNEIHTDQTLKEVVEKHRDPREKTSSIQVSNTANTANTANNENTANIANTTNMIKSNELPYEQLTLEKALDAKFFKKILPRYLKVNDEIVRISIEVRDIFPPGRAMIQKEYQADLNRLVETVVAKSGEGYIDVESYTDLTPVIKNKKFFPTNWELSSARAATLLRLFVDRGFPKEKIRLIGYGPTQRGDVARSLASTNPSDRRIELVLKSKGF